jgi:hypothetical protein
MWEMRYVYKILIRKPEGKRPIGRPRGRWEDNITMDHRETGWKVVDWILWLRTGTNGGML